MLIQHDEGIGLVPQNVRVDRLEQKVHRARLVTAKHSIRFAGARGQENDRNVFGTLRAAHEFGELEAVHLRHLHIDERQRELVLQDQLNALVARACGDDVRIVPTQQRFERDQVLLDVVDHQNARTFGHDDLPLSSCVKPEAISLGDHTRVGSNKASAAAGMMATSADSGDCTMVVPPAA